MRPVAQGVTESGGNPRKIAQRAIFLALLPPLSVTPPDALKTTQDKQDN
jgi:hypothetical protein